MFSHVKKKNEKFSFLNEIKKVIKKVTLKKIILKVQNVHGV